MKNKTYNFERVFPAGYKVYNSEGDFIGYAPDNYGQGKVYKDDNAFMTGEGICYIAEHAFDNCREIDGRPIRYFDTKEGVTRADIFKAVKGSWAEDYMLTDEQVEYVAKVFYAFLDWQCIATLLYEAEFINDVILGNFQAPKFEGFTTHQREAVEGNLTPLEYADRDPYMSELAQWGSEFENAFQFTEAEAEEKDILLMEYIDCRRKGEVENPEQFAGHISFESARHYKG